MKYRLNVAIRKKTIMDKKRIIKRSNRRTNCPACGSSNFHVNKETHQGEDVCECYCYDCDFYWTA